MLGGHKPDLQSLLENLSENHRRNSCLMSNRLISPFFNSPYDYIRPGTLTPDVFRLHEIYPELFLEEAGFMGQRKGSIGDDGQRWVNVWEVKVREGYFNNFGNFYAPFALYQTIPLKENNQKSQFIIFQQGSYQFYTPETEEELRNLLDFQLVKVYRGIRNRMEFEEASLKNRQEELVESGRSFLSCTISFGCNNVSRDETNHIVPTHIYEGFDLRHEKSYSLRKKNASQKFGPNYVVFQTNVDNLRILSQWTGEREVRILDRLRAIRIE